MSAMLPQAYLPTSRAGRLLLYPPRFPVASDLAIWQSLKLSHCVCSISSEAAHRWLHRSLVWVALPSLLLSRVDPKAGSTFQGNECAAERCLPGSARSYPTGCEGNLGVATKSWNNRWYLRTFSNLASSRTQFIWARSGSWIHFFSPHRLWSRPSSTLGTQEEYKLHTPGVPLP